MSSKDPSAKIGSMVEAVMQLKALLKRLPGVAGTHATTPSSALYAVSNQAIHDC